jgi:hypothetical protein
MQPSDRYVQQHHDILSAGKKLVPLLKQARLKSEASAARRALGVLSKKVKLHFAVDEATLYPQLVGSTRVVAVAIGLELRKSLSVQRARFLAYESKYPRAKDIEANPAAFVEDSKATLLALEVYMKSEETEIYPLLDLAQESQPWAAPR